MKILDTLLILAIINNQLIIVQVLKREKVISQKRVSIFRIWCKQGNHFIKRFDSLFE